MGILEAIAGVLLLLWIGGLFLNVAGGLIHILLVAAIAVFTLRFFRNAY